jgi:hypothetical protein
MRLSLCGGSKVVKIDGLTPLTAIPGRGQAAVTINFSKNLFHQFLAISLTFPVEMRLPSATNSPWFFSASSEKNRLCAPWVLPVTPHL